MLNRDDKTTQKASQLNLEEYFLLKSNKVYALRDIARRVGNGQHCGSDVVTLGDLAPHQSAFIRFTETEQTC